MFVEQQRQYRDTVGDNLFSSFQLDWGVIYELILNIKFLDEFDVNKKLLKL